MALKLIAVSCNECGAKLSVGETSRFVTCKHCETQLAVHHEAGATFTEVAEAARRVEASAEAIEGHAVVMTSQNQGLLLEKKIARLDRDWENTRQGYMRRSKDGSLHAVTRGQAIMLGFLVPLTFLPLIGPKLSHPDFEAPTYAWLLVTAMAIAIGIATLRLYRTAERYEIAHRRHESERDALVAALDALETPKKRIKKKSKGSQPRTKRA